VKGTKYLASRTVMWTEAIHRNMWRDRNPA